MSSFVEISEANDSEVLPCSCSASWKLHSIAIKVMWSSRAKRKDDFKKILMRVESPALLLSPLSVGVPITGVSGTIFFGFSFLSCCSFKFTLKMMVPMRINKTRLGSRDQTKGHTGTVRQEETADIIAFQSKHSWKEIRWNHPTICEIFALDVTESISHGDNLLIWILTPSRKGGFVRNLHAELFTV